MQVDSAKAEIIFERLMEAFYAKRFPYSLPNATAPQIPENMPKKLTMGSRAHALFLFCLCYYMRGGNKSHTVTKQLSRLYDGCPELFLPENRHDYTPAQVADKLRGVGLGFNAEETGDMWIDNFNRMESLWGGDPANIFKGVSTYEEACDRVQNHKKKKNVVGYGFRGFQEKMVSMLIYFLMDAGFVDRWHFPVPVDFHVLRTMFAHEIITAAVPNGGGFYTKEVLAATRELFLGYCVRHNVDPLRLCDAVWLYSGLMCNLHPGNRSDVAKDRNGRRTEVKPVKKWTKRQKRVYEDRGCGQCFVRDTCRWCVPSANYYIKGQVILRGERDDPPGQMFLFTALED
jgi:hypothetical protein